MIPALSRATPNGADSWILWASTLSPFALKVDACCDYKHLAHRWLPAEGSRSQGLAAALRVRRIASRTLPLTHPVLDPLDEFPLVPFLLGPRGENLFDSSAIGEWLDRRTSDAAETRADALLPRDDEALHFAIRLVDEYFDELGLYLVHHNRWKVAARDNGAGLRLAADFRPLAGPLSHLLAWRFPARQVRRLPYLFSVAPSGSHEWDDLPGRLRPPARAGFPPTHALLEDHFSALLAILERLLTKRPYLFGERFTLADASAYGQLGMNLSDASAERWIRNAAPGVRAWLGRIANADFTTSRPNGELALDEAAAPVLAHVCRLFVPLMQQNQAAYEQARAAGETLFNEAAFDRGRARYEGELAGSPFCSVIKTFQVRVWRDLQRDWAALSPEARERLEAVLPADHGIGDR